ncbi:cupin domain-containing protein [Candidatus Marimicrobium litorale]|uniref:Cupin domain-containing protein n=1 Tax=Candidatus Marimicrobium litorale TaxID=2518991 RepID=A0ABT3T7Q2_9GAMM|nr:cupin domain-containing protein [Candidatus Marimicrobium litorale]MCX2978306.1 cupin domain-containing protein [Candidatus Marimicrobium litorale]
MTRINIILLILLLSGSGIVLAIDGSDMIKATPVLKTQRTWIGQDIVYPEGQAEMSGVVIEMAPGGETGWHKHPVPSVGYVIEGQLEVHFKNGDVKKLNAGEAAAEAVDVWHNGVNVGEGPVKLVVFYVGTANSQLTEREDSE